MGWGATTSTRNLTGFDTDDLSEGSSNLYFTNARADARIAMQPQMIYLKVLVIFITQLQEFKQYLLIMLLRILRPNLEATLT